MAKEEIIAKIRSAAEAKNIDPDVALKIAGVESSFDPTAQNPKSTAGGLFQIIDDTWHRYGGRKNMKKDLDENIRVGTDIIADNTHQLRKFLGREPQGHEVYAAHFFGPGTAKQVLQADKRQFISTLVPSSVIKANPNLKDQTVGQWIDSMQSKFIGEQGPKLAKADVSRGTKQVKVNTSMPSRLGPRNLSQLGPGYQAAMAAMALADTNDEGDSQYTGEAQSAKASLAGLNLQVRSPFEVMYPQKEAQVAPQMFREGGEAVSEEAELPAKEDFQVYKGANKMRQGPTDMESVVAGVNFPVGEGGFNLMGNLSKMTREGKEQMARAMLASLSQKFGDADVRVTLNKPMGPGTEGVTMGDLSASYPLGKGRVMAGTQMADVPGWRGNVGQMVGYQGQVGPGQLSAMANYGRGGARNMQLQYQLPLGRAEGGEVKEPLLFSVPAYSETRALEMYPSQKGQYDQQDAVRHMLAAGTLTRKYGPKVAEALGQAHEIKTSPLRWVGSKLGITEMPVDYQQDLHNNRLGIELGSRSTSQADLERLVEQMSREAQKEQTQGKAWVGKPVKRADGSPIYGEIATAPISEDTKAAFSKSTSAREILQKLKEVGADIGKGGLSNLESLARGAAASSAGQFGEIEKLGRMGYNLVAKKPVSEETVLPTTEDIYKKLPQRMTAPRQETSGMETMGEFMAPVAEVGAIKGTTKAAKMLEDMTVGNMQRAKIKKAAKQAEALPPTAYDPLRERMAASGNLAYAVRPEPGGHFTYAPSVGMDDVDIFLTDFVGVTKDAPDPVDKWMHKRLSSYMRGTMATEQDPLVRAVDQGKRLHFMEGEEGLFTPSGESSLGYIRERMGLPIQGTAQSGHGRRVERSIDLSIQPSMLEDISERNMTPKMLELSKTAPNTPVYEVLFEELESVLRPEEMRTGLKMMLNDKQLPASYQLTPEQLQKMTLPEASEKIANFNHYIREKESLEFLQNSKTLPAYKRYDDGYRWLAPGDVSEDEAARKYVLLAGKRMGLCTKEVASCMNYASGDKRVFPLVDNRNLPVAQIATEEVAPDVLMWLRGMDFDTEKKYRDEYMLHQIEQLPEYIRWARDNTYRYVNEIKGMFNETNLEGPILEKAQDFVRTGNWDHVNELAHAKLVDGRAIGHNIKGESATKGTRIDLPDEVVEQALKNQFGTVYLKEEEIEPAKAMIQMLADNAPKKVLNRNKQGTPMIGPDDIPFAKGGLVERQYTQRSYI